MDSNTFRGWILAIENVAEIVGIVRDFILILAFLIAALVLLLIYRKLSSVLDSARQDAQER